MKIRKLKVRKNAKHPGESIIAYAHREGCDLIVTGTRAQYSRERMWEESISNYCVWHSWIPVLGKIDHILFTRRADVFFRTCHTGRDILVSR